MPNLPTPPAPGITTPKPQQQFRLHQPFQITGTAYAAQAQPGGGLATHLPNRPPGGVRTAVDRVTATIDSNPPNDALLDSIDDISLNRPFRVDGFALETLGQHTLTFISYVLDQPGPRTTITIVGVPPVWSPQENIPGTATSNGPALAAFPGGSLYAAWEGASADQGIYYAPFDGTRWFGQVNIPGVGTSVGPSLVYDNGSLYAAWKGASTDNRIFYSSYEPFNVGNRWADQQVIPGATTSVGPSLSDFRGSIIAAWKGSADENIYWATFANHEWTAPEVIPEVATSHGPALAFFNGKLYAAWKGTSGDQGIYWSSFDGTKWAAQVNIPGVGTSVGPSLAVVDDKLYAAWKGEFDDQGIYWATFDGTNWDAQAKIPGVGTSHRPSLAAFTGTLYAAWKGALTDQKMYWASLK